MPALPRGGTLESRAASRASSSDDGATGLAAAAAADERRAAAAAAAAAAPAAPPAAGLGAAATSTAAAERTPPCSRTGVGPLPTFRCLFLAGRGVRRSHEAAAVTAVEGTEVLPPPRAEREALAGATAAGFPAPPPPAAEKTPLTDRRGLGGDWKGPLAVTAPFPAELFGGIGGGSLAVGEGVWLFAVAVEGLARLVASWLSLGEREGEREEREKRKERSAVEGGQSGGKKKCWPECPRLRPPVCPLSKLRCSFFMLKCYWKTVFTAQTS